MRPHFIQRQTDTILSQKSEENEGNTNSGTKSTHSGMWQRYLTHAPLTHCHQPNHTINPMLTTNQSLSHQRNVNYQSQPSTQYRLPIRNINPMSSTNQNHQHNVDYQSEPLTRCHQPDHQLNVNWTINQSQQTIWTINSMSIEPYTQSQLLNWTIWCHLLNWIIHPCIFTNHTPEAYTTHHTSYTR